MQLPGTLTVSLHDRASSPRASSNVAGLIPGSDPKLGDEVVVLSAHLDHLGVGRADRTATRSITAPMDNASASPR